MEKNSIKLVKEQDFPILLDMIKEFADYLGKSDKVKMTTAILKENKENFQAFFVETEEKEQAGYALCYFTFHTWTGKTLYIEDIYIKEKYRGNSIGEKFMQELAEFARRNQCSSLNWQVLNWNEKAIRFYNKIGAVVGDDNLNCSLEIEK